MTVTGSLSDRGRLGVCPQEPGPNGGTFGGTVVGEAGDGISAISEYDG